MAVVEAPVFFDTSVFVAGLLEVGDEWQPAQEALKAVAEGGTGPYQTAWHCCLEFYAVSTRLPEDFRVTPGQALQLLEEAIVPHFKVVELPASKRLPFLRMVASERVAGGRLYDAHIAEVARLGGAATVVTGNPRHFTTLLRHGIRVLTAAHYANRADD